MRCCNLSRRRRSLSRRLEEIRWFIQRGCRGWSIKDTWGFDCYITKIMSEGVAWLAEHDHGYPGHEPWDTPEKWQAYLRDLSSRLGAWTRDDAFLDDEAYKVTAAAVEEFGRNLGHFWD